MPQTRMMRAISNCPTTPRSPKGNIERRSEAWLSVAERVSFSFSACVTPKKIKASPPPRLEMVKGAMILNDV